MGLHNRCPLNTSGQRGHHIIFTLCRWSGGSTWVWIGCGALRWLCGRHWSRKNKAISELKCHKSDGRKTNWPHTVCIFSCSARGLKGSRTENRGRSILKTKVECWGILRFMKLRPVWTDGAHFSLAHMYKLGNSGLNGDFDRLHQHIHSVFGVCSGTFKDFPCLPSSPYHASVSVTQQLFVCIPLHNTHQRKMSVLHWSAGYGMGLKVESTGSGDPLPGLMGNEGSSDPFSPWRAPQPPFNYTAGVSVFAWSITSQPLHLLSCTHRLQDNQCPKLLG